MDCVRQKIPPVTQRERERDHHAHTQYYFSLSLLSLSTPPVSPPSTWLDHLIGTLSDFAPLLRKRSGKLRVWASDENTNFHESSSPLLHGVGGLVEIPPSPQSSVFSRVLEGYIYLEIILRVESGKAEETPGITDPSPQLSLPPPPPRYTHTTECVHLSPKLLCATCMGPHTHTWFLRFSQEFGWFALSPGFLAQTS